MKKEDTKTAQRLIRIVIRRWEMVCTKYIPTVENPFRPIVIFLQTVEVGQ